jgi:hypothetical protein
MRIRTVVLSAISAMGTAGFVLAGSAAASASTAAPAGLWQPNLHYHTSAPAAPKAVRGPEHCFCFNGPKAVRGGPKIVPADDWWGPIPANEWLAPDLHYHEGPALLSDTVTSGPKVLHYHAITAGPKLKFAPRLTAGPKLKFAPRLTAGPKVVRGMHYHDGPVLAGQPGLHYHD